MNDLILTQIASLRERIKHWQIRNESTAFVPTMGNLHAGHLALVTTAKQRAQHVVVSIFVNPLQFGPNEDFATYPRTQEADIEKLTALNVDAIFIPETSELFPQGQSLTAVSVSQLSDSLCGKTRPGHFTGVATIVAKLFNIVQPQVAVFGEKDYQQLTIIRKMVADLNFPIEIIGQPTLREADGLALSSRNQYLSVEERMIAPKLYAILCWMQQEIKNGNSAFAELCAYAKAQLTQYNFKVDYIDIRTETTLEIPTAIDTNLIILAAAFLGKTRLIDNISAAIPAKKSEAETAR
ncbi:MAG TPA: pantoate--beta-alanine ligase [Gammaproteobacteria bacterium]|nr:pantoate--beta-alanine ligase [Gammaproteobacteria bacterium]